MDLPELSSARRYTGRSELMIVAQTYKQNQDATEIARIELQALALRYFEGTRMTR